MLAWDGRADHSEESYSCIVGDNKSIQSIKSITFCNSAQTSGSGSGSVSVSLKVRRGPYEMHSSSPARMSRRVVYVISRFSRSRSQPTFWWRLEWLNMLPRPKMTACVVVGGLVGCEPRTFSVSGGVYGQLLKLCVSY